MQLGVVFPQTEIGNDPAVVRDYGQAAEGLGYKHVLAFDHVLGGNAATHDLRGPYKHTDAFHEPFVLFGFLAAVTGLEFVTGIIILPQRQTALVAKQAAALDVLCEGRLRPRRGGRLEPRGVRGARHGLRGPRTAHRRADRGHAAALDQRAHHLRGARSTASPIAGLNPLPVQQPIPVWLGGHAEAVLRRTARYGDGWFPLLAPDDEGAAEVEKLHGYIREAGRDPSEVGIETWLNMCWTSRPSSGARRPKAGRSSAPPTTRSTR